MKNISDYADAELLAAAKFIYRCQQSGIKNPVAFLKEKSSDLWGFLKGALPRGGIPTDIDGFVELRGNHLFIENKHISKFDELPLGQSIAYKSLARTSIVYIIGNDDNGNPQKLRIVGGKRDGERHENINQKGIYKLVETWGNWAEKKENWKN